MRKTWGPKAWGRCGLQSALQIRRLLDSSSINMNVLQRLECSKRQMINAPRVKSHQMSSSCERVITKMRLDLFTLQEFRAARETTRTRKRNKKKEQKFGDDLAEILTEIPFFVMFF